MLLSRIRIDPHIATFCRECHRKICFRDETIFADSAQNYYCANCAKLIEANQQKILRGTNRLFRGSARKVN